MANSYTRIFSFMKNDITSNVNEMYTLLYNSEKSMEMSSHFQPKKNFGFFVTMIRTINDKSRPKNTGFQKQVRRSHQTMNREARDCLTSWAWPCPPAPW